MEVRKVKRHRSLFLVLIFAGFGLIALVATSDQRQRIRLDSVVSSTKEIAEMKSCEEPERLKDRNVVELLECEVLTPSGRVGIIELQRRDLAEFEGRGVEIGFDHQEQMIVTDAAMVSRQKWMTWYLYAVGGICVFLGIVFLFRNRKASTS